VALLAIVVAVILVLRPATKPTGQAAR